MVCFCQHCLETFFLPFPEKKKELQVGMTVDVPTGWLQENADADKITQAAVEKYGDSAGQLAGIASDRHG